MTYHAQQTFGQASACAAGGPATVDKWQLIDALGQAASAFGITHRQLGVLRALVSFHRARHWPVTADKLIVYPSNRTLADRLGGMPDSTLRRHLATLVKAGLITRHASSNGKRFRRGRGEHEVAFGLDLGPLVRLSARIRQAARATAEASEARAALRTRLLALRQELRQSTTTDHAAFLDDLARALRRCLSLDDLHNWITQTRDRLRAIAKKTSGTDDQNERHIDSDHRKKTSSQRRLTPQRLDALCPRRKAWLPGSLHDWQDVIHSATQVAPLIGLSDDVLRRLLGKHGKHDTAIAVLAMLELSDQIENPSGYLASMSQNADLAGILLERLENR